MGISDPNIINQKILLDGEEVTIALLGFSVSYEINRVPRARLEFNYRQLDKTEAQQQVYILKQAKNFDPPVKKSKHDFLPGKKIEIQLSRGTSQALVTVFEGYIISQNIVSNNDGGLYLYVECRHVCNRMALHKRTRFHHHDANNGNSSQEDIDQVNDLDVLKKLIEYYQPDLGNLVAEDTRRTGGKYDNMVQYNCTDWDFLIIRAEALGYVCLVDGNDIHLVYPEIQSLPTQKFKLGKDIYEYEAVYDETFTAKVNHITGWDVEKLDRHYDNLKNSLAETELDVIHSDVTVNYGAPLETGEATRWLVNEIMRQEQATIQGLLKVRGTEKIKLNDTISISGFDSVWDGERYVSGIKHSLHEGLWHTYIQCGIDKTPHAEKFNIGRLETPFVPKTDGLLIGKIIQYKKNDAGSEMIEVELPSYEQDETTQTVFARLANFSAGQHGGSVFRPYPGDEVVLGFVNNDPRFPIILGSLYNSNQLPVYDFEDSETQPEVGFSINGWKISIHEKDELFTIASPGGQHVVLDDSNGSIAMVYDDNNSITLTSEGIELNAKKITINGTNGIVMEGMQIEAKADTSIKLEATTQLELEGKVTASLKGQITQIN